MSSDSGNLKLDTDTLSFRDIAGKDKEHGYYLNVSGNYGGSGAQTDKPNKGMEGPDKNSWTVEGYNYNKDREQIVRATIGTGEIVVRNDKVTGEDSTVGLNRDLDKAYEVTRDEEHRTELYASSTSIDAVAHPVETTKAWAADLARYDDIAKGNFDLAGSIIGNLLDALQHPGAGTEAIKAGGAEIAAQALSALLDAGYDRKDARALLENKDFQNKILVQLGALVNQGSDSIADAEDALASVIGEKNILVTDKAFTLDQRIVYGAATISEYIQKNPDKASAVEYVLAAAQGPKGLILLAAQKALDATPAGQAIAEYENAAMTTVGKLIADSLDDKNHDLNNADDAWVVGGGKLMAALLIGASTTGAAKVASAGKKISVAGADKVQLDGLTGAKGVGAAPKITIRDHYDHHLNMVDDIKDQLSAQGYRVSNKEISFGSSCGIGRCRPDIVAEAPDGSIRIIEVKTGSADLSIRQSEIFPQIRDGSSIPRGKVARDFGLIPGKPLREQGYPNGIPIEIKNFPGAK